MLKFDWAFGVLASIWRVQVQIDFQIQMEEEGISVERICPYDDPSPFTDPQESCAGSISSYSDMIGQLLAQNESVFKVISPPSAPPKGRYQQELLQHKILTYNRKAKSLQFLSQRFIQNFELNNDVVLNLQDVTGLLKVERRRMYDIINIFQSLDMVKRKKKNHYDWLGIKQAIRTITAIQQGSDQNQQKDKNPASQKSLECLSGLILKVFISSQQPLTLEEALREIVLSQSERKTKLRRLYDIVNVFKSLGLIEKIKSEKKPLFKWLGVQGLQNKIQQIKKKAEGKGSESQSEENSIKNPEQAKIEENIPQDSERKMEISERASIYSKKMLSTKEPKMKKSKSCKLDDKKENKLNLSNSANINDWFSAEDRLAFSSLAIAPTFTQKKIFLPNIIQRETSSTLAGSQDTIIDISLSY